MSQTSQHSAGWVPRTKVGKMVQSGELVSIQDIFTQGLKIMESEITDILLPDLKQEVLGINFVQKQTDAGERSRFKAIVAVGNEQSFIGIGGGKARQVRTAIDKATVHAKLTVIPVRRGCGSWECGCGQPHTLPFSVTGKCGSVRIQIIPGPKGLGRVAGEMPKTILRLAGITDCWTRTYGSTSTLASMSSATYDALRSTYRVVTSQDWAG